MNITEISIKRPSLIIVLFSLFTLLGIIGYKNLSYELMPDFNQPVVVIKTVYPGAEPNEVETSVSRKIEDALSNLEGVDYLVTKSLPNASIIIANLKYGTDLDKTMQNAQRYIDNIRKDLPVDILSPVMSKVSPNDLPIMSISATSNLTSTEFYQKMKDEFLPQIQQIKGVAEITLLGGEEREIQVKINQDKLKLYKISMVQVVEAINRSGLDLPAGKVQTEKESNSVRLTGKFTSLEDIKNVQVAMPVLGSPVYVKDVANIIVFLMETRKNSGLYNVGTGEARTCKDLVISTFTALNIEPIIDFIDTPEDIRDKYQYFTQANMNKLRSIGYTAPFYSLEDGVKDYVQNYLQAHFG